jgi:mannosyltransferase
MIARKQAAFTIGCLLILLIGFALRLTRLDLSLNYDELVTANSILIDRLNPTKVEARMFVYLLMTAPLGLLVPNEWGMRWTSVMAGVLTIALSYRVATRIGDRRAGLIAAVIIAVAPLYIYYSQIARYYSLVPCIALMSLFLLLEQRLNSRRWAYPLSLTLLSGLHMLAVVWSATQIAVMAAHKAITGRGVRWSMLLASVAGIAAMLGLIQLIGLVGRFNFGQGLTWIPVRSPIVDFIFFMGSALGLMLDFGQTELPFRVVNSIIAAVGLISGVGLWRRWKARINQTDWSIPLLIALAAIPNLIMVGITHTIVPIFVVRYVTPSAVAVVLLVGVGMSAVRPAWIANSTLAVVVLASLMSFHAFNTKPEYRREEWRSAVSELQKRWTATDQILTCTSAGAVALNYYAPGISHQPLETTEPFSEGRVWVIGVPSQCGIDSLQEKAAWLKTYRLEDELNFPNIVVYLYELELADE